MRRPRTRADSSVSRPTTAPIMSFAPPVTCFSGRRRCKISPSDPPTNTAAPIESANFSGFIHRLPARRPSTIASVRPMRSSNATTGRSGGAMNGSPRNRGETRAALPSVFAYASVIARSRRAFGSTPVSRRAMATKQSRDRRAPCCPWIAGPSPPLVYSSICGRRSSCRRRRAAGGRSRGECPRACRRSRR